jgi:hypothetical protein
MATKPKTPEERLQAAQYVYVGRIGDVREQEVPDPAGTNILVEADMDVDAVEKEIITGSAEEQVTLHYWRAGKRAPGWSGDTGQHSPVQPGSRIRAFVVYGNDGRAMLVDPNGWEPADQA